MAVLNYLSKGLTINSTSRVKLYSVPEDIASAVVFSGTISNRDNQNKTVHFFSLELEYAPGLFRFIGNRLAIPFGVSPTLPKINLTGSQALWVTASASGVLDVSAHLVERANGAPVDDDQAAWEAVYAARDARDTAIGVVSGVLEARDAAAASATASEQSRVQSAQILEEAVELVSSDMLDDTNISRVKIFSNAETLERIGDAIDVFSADLDSDSLHDAGTTGKALIKSETSAAARLAIALDQVNNTTDANKPISTATATALAGLHTEIVNLGNEVNDDIAAIGQVITNLIGTAPNQVSTNAMLLNINFPVSAIQAQAIADAVATGTSVNDLIFISTDTNAVVGKTYVFEAACKLTLPVTTTKGATISVIDLSASKAVTIDPNGSKIRGNAEVMTINIDKAKFSLQYSGTNVRGWI